MPPPDPLALAMNRPMPLDPNDPTAFMRSIIDAQGRQQIWDTMGGFASGLLQSAAPSPVPRDFGSVFGAGIQGALQGQRGGEDQGESARSESTCHALVSFGPSAAGNSRNRPPKETARRQRWFRAAGAWFIRTA